MADKFRYLSKLSNTPMARLPSNNCYRDVLQRLFTQVWIMRRATFLPSGLVAVFCSWAISVGCEQKLWAQRLYPPPNIPGMGYTNAQESSSRAIRTAVPFLLISPDAASTALGGSGVSTLTLSANDVYWNGGKLALIDKKAGVNLSYTPWPQDLSNEMFLANIAGYYKLGRLQTLGLSLQYFNLGTYDLLNQQGAVFQHLSPRELALSLAYARRLSPYVGLSLSGKFIHSNLAPDFVFSNQLDAQAGQGFAFDLGVYYRRVFDNTLAEWQWSWGLAIQNIGPKFSYGQLGDAQFLPTNLRLGTSLGCNLDFFNRLTGTVELGKLLVPTPPKRDAQGLPLRGMDPTRMGVLQGMLSSFADAPNGMREELQELAFSLGLQYSYDELLFVRVGYHHQHVQKGNRRFLSTGVGVKFDVFSIDFAYLFNFSFDQAAHETLRISTGLDFPSHAARPIQGSQAHLPLSMGDQGVLKNSQGSSISPIQ